MNGFPAALDHVVIATPDLQATLRTFREATGVEPTPGGVHPGRGTRNHLVSFGGLAYLEIIGLDPATAGEPEGEPPFRLATVTEPVVATWAIHPADPDAALRRASGLGRDLGVLGQGSRRDTAGNLLRWRLSRTYVAEESGVVPFVIDWGSTTSPAVSTPAAATLESFTATHPEPDRVRAVLDALGADLAVEPGEAGLRVRIAGPSGVFELG